MPLGPAAAGGWSIVTSPNASSAPTTNILNAVTCASASDCWAVGYAPAGNATQTLVERWTGTSWTIVTSPNTSATQNNILTGVSCVSTSDCWAVGYYFAGSSAAQTLIERWNGNSWTIVTSPNTSATQSNVLSSVTCVSASDCWAVGYYYDGSYFNNSVRQTLIERWNGTSWSIVTSPNTSATQSNVLSSVTCASASDCWAVGSYPGSSASRTLVERWDGASWSIITSPNTSATQNNFLSGVSCVSASNCWAVGSYSGSNASQTLIERWDGTSWSITTSPNTSATQNNFLQAVTCASTSNCWAVGYYVVGNVYQTLVERWDGNSWVIVASPNPSGAQSTYLQAVTCASAAADCWGVGYYYPGGGGGAQTLVERWDGTSWVIATSPNNGATQSNILSGTTCVSASDCWAVGYYLNGNGIAGLPAYQTLIEHWDGNSWSIVTSPNTSPTQNNFLLAMQCTSASDCWAVGYYKLGNAYQTLTEHWDGNSWNIVTSPNASATHDNVLFGVTCASASDCWAVGYSVNVILNLIGANQTLVEHWNGISWSIVTSANTLPVQDNFLQAVACASASDCWAVGYTAVGVTYQTLVEHWDGNSWAIVTSPNASATQNNFLSGVTCLSTSDCRAVGYSTANTSQTLTERWDGTSWTIVASPNTSTNQNNFLSGVTCASPSDCWAIGYYNNTTANQTLIERWDGTSWTIATSPNISATQNNLLSGVTCALASDCWAVGYYNDASGYAQTLVERFSLPPVQLVNVVSRKVHGSAGSFDINLPLIGPRGVECRSGGASNDYTMVFIFANTLTSVGGAGVTSGTGMVRSSTIGSDAHQYIMNLTGVTNAQTITATLTNVTDSAGDFSPAVAGSMGVLIGDTDANGIVSNTDVAAVKAQVAAPVTSSNFRNDVTANGTISNTDVSAAKAQVGTALPSSP